MTYLEVGKETAFLAETQATRASATTRRPLQRTRAQETWMALVAWSAASTSKVRPMVRKVTENKKIHTISPSSMKKMKRRKKVKKRN